MSRIIAYAQLRPASAFAWESYVDREDKKARREAEHGHQLYPCHLTMPRLVRELRKTPRLPTRWNSEANYSAQTSYTLSQLWYTRLFLLVNAFEPGSIREQTSVDYLRMCATKNK